MYLEQLYLEAAMIVRGREAYLRDAADAWTRFRTWLGFSKA